EDAHDVRMREARGEPSFAEEAGAQVLVAGEILGETLQGDRPLELDVVREVDDGHRTVPERPLDLVPARDERRPQSPPSPLACFPLWPWPCGGGGAGAGGVQALCDTSSLTPPVSGSRKRGGTRCAFTAAITE